jgi:Flp pilus assembly protein protease CpaA
MDFFFLIPLAIFGIICSYTDVKYSKILNKWILLALIYIFLLYSVLLITCILSGNEENISGLFNLIKNGFLSFLGGYLLWNLRLWSAGDAKLFTIYVLLIPPQYYSKSYFFFFPPLNLLINLFFPFVVFLLINIIITVLRESYNFSKNKKFLILLKRDKILKILFSLIEVLSNYFFIIALLELRFFLKESFILEKILNNPLCALILILLAIIFLKKLKKKYPWLNFIIYALVGLYFFTSFFAGQIQILMNKLKSAIIFIFLLKLIIKSFNFYIHKKEVSKINIKKLKEGMILAQNDIALLFNKMDEKIKEEFGQNDAGGLNKKQVDLIKNLFIKEPEKTLSTYKTIPFAPFLFLSAVISITSQSSFFPYLDKALHWFSNLL